MADAAGDLFKYQMLITHIRCSVDGTSDTVCVCVSERE